MNLNSQVFRPYLTLHYNTLQSQIALNYQSRTSGEDGGGVRGGGPRVCPPHLPGLPPARLHRTPGGGLLLQQEQCRQALRLRQSKANGSFPQHV